ncbi:MAG TPA: VOC family protein [Pyrinomonadaceae bacterium]|jgi:catechol 2,3-dioxygenase-like lactoylglutathione lyase family enzyme|nr:VOC family protein [Pyrinomonadaceae bacterium]
MAKKIIGQVVWLGLVVKNFKAQQEFYRDVLGLKELTSGPHWAHFELDATHMLELMTGWPEPPHGRRCFRPGFQVEDIKAARRALAARGLEPTSDIQGGKKFGSFWCSFKDADGNYFELKQLVSSSARRASKPRRSAGKKARAARP